MREDIDNINNINDIEIIEWAFEKGYRLACADSKDGVHIDFNETKKYFLNELNEFREQQSNMKYASR